MHTRLQLSNALICRIFFNALAVLVAALPGFAGVIVTQGVAPGATNWPGSPIIQTMTNPAVQVSVGESFNAVGGCTNYCQTFTVTTNYTLQTISIYAGGGTGTAAGTNLTLRLFDLGTQTAPNPSPYTPGSDLFNSGNGLSITYTQQTAGVLQFDFTGSDQITLINGHMYAFEMNGGLNTSPLSWQRATSETYSGGAAYRNQAWINSNNARDFGMAIYAVAMGVSNNAPTDISLSSSSVLEGQPTGTAAGTFSTTDPDSGNTFTYALVSGTGSTDNGSFTITNNTLYTAAVFDYAVQTNYNIRVSSTDQGGLNVEKVFAITVTPANFNNAPTNISLSNSSAAENQPAGTVLGTFDTTDPDSGNTFTYALVSGTGSTGNGSFTITNSTLYTAVMFNYEVQNSYSIRVRSTDQGGLLVEKAFTITVTNVNEAPTNISLSNSSVAEGQPTGTAAGTFSTTDPDSGNTFTYALVSGTGSTDNGSFTITNNTLYTAAVFNYAVQTNYNIRVSSTDQGGLNVEKAFTITVTGTNLPSLPSAQATVNWNDVRQQIDGFGGGVVFMNGSPPDNLSAAYMDTAFGTNANQLALTLLRIRIDPNGNNSAALANAQKAFARGAAVMATPWTAPASMKDNNSTVHGSVLPAQYTNYANYLNNFAAYMKANGVPLKAISIQNEPDYDPSYEGCLWSAAQFLTFFRNVAGLITNAPVMMPESASYNKSVSDATLNDPTAVTNVALVGLHLYSNGDAGQTITDYPLAHNKGKPTWMTEFLVNDQTIGTAITTAKQIHNCLTVGNMSAYVWWKAFGDANGLVNASGVPQKRGFVVSQWSRFLRTNNFRIGVINNTNSAISAYKDPNGGGFAVVAINTNAANAIYQGFNLTNFNATTVTPWITSATMSRSNQAPVAVVNGSFSYTLPAQSVVTFVGQGDRSNSAPTDITLSTAAIAENQPGGITVGTFNTVDPDTDSTFTYSLASGTGSTNNAAFTISSNVLRTAASFDYETKNSYSIRVRSSDQFNLSVEKVFMITVTNVNDAPMLSPVGNQTVNPGVTVVITNSVTDSDVPPQTLTFALLTAPTNATLTSLNASNAVFTWRPLISQANSTNPIQVKVTDNGTPNLSATNNFIITVNPASQPALSSITVGGVQVSLSATGMLGPDYALLTSTNLVDWHTLFTTNPATMPFSLSDTNISDAMRFYRLQLGP